MRPVFSLVLSLALAGSLALNSTAAIPESSVSNVGVAISTIPGSPNLGPLKAAIAEYQSNRCSSTWSSLAQDFKIYLSTNPNPSNDELKTSGLAELGVLCIQQPALKLWYFPQITEDRGLYLQWPEAASKSPKHKAAAAVAPQHAMAHVQYLSLPSGVVLKDARMLALAHHTDDQHLAAAPVVRKKPASHGSHNTTVHHLKVAGATTNKFLILAGLQQSRKTLWLECYQLSGGTWRQSTAPLSKIPPFLLGSLVGDISFTGNDLVLTASPSGSQETPSTAGGSSKGKRPDLSVYKLSLRLVDNYYLLDGQGHPDTAYSTITQFLQAEQKGRPDLAKGWLEDQSAASIPKYLKLFNQGSLSSFRLISLSAPRSIYRYRLITFGKDDLIFDVGHPKDQWIIKAIFVAPSDIGWQRIAESLPPIM